MINFSRRNVGSNRIWPWGVHRLDGFISTTLYSLFHPSFRPTLAESMAGDRWVDLVLFGLPYIASRFTITLQRFEAFVADGICQSP